MEDHQMKAITTLFATLLMPMFIAINASAGLPDPGMEVDSRNTAIVITDPQNDFLSPDGVTWGVVGESVTANNTVANIDSVLTQK